MTGNLQHAELIRHRQTLDNRFFIGIEDAIVRRLQEDAQTEAGRDKLALVSGISDPELLKEIADIGVNAESFAAILMSPMILVAWADHKIDEPERTAILAQIQENGIEADSIPYVLIEHWLHRRPPHDLAHIWEECARTLMARLTEHGRRTLCEKLMHQVRLVAKASGGVMGIGAISLQEKRIIQMLEAAIAPMANLHDGTNEG